MHKQKVSYQHKWSDITHSAYSIIQIARSLCEWANLHNVSLLYKYNSK